MLNYLNKNLSNYYVRSLAIISLDVIVDPDEGEYQSLVIKHPIIRDYPHDWETTLRSFLRRETKTEELPQLVGYVDRSLNRDYRTPDWTDVYVAASGFASL